MHIYGYVQKGYAANLIAYLTTPTLPHLTSTCLLIGKVKDKGGSQHLDLVTATLIESHWCGC